MHHRIARRAIALALSLPLPALAQNPVDPADPGAPARELSHDSAFADYKPFQDIAPGDWRRLNETVGGETLGQEAVAPAPAMGVPSTTTLGPGHPAHTQPMPDHHQHMHGGQK